VIEQDFWHVRFEVLVVINMMIYTFWDVTPCSWVDGPRSHHIRGT